MSQFTDEGLNQYDLRRWKEYLDERLGDLERQQVDKRFFLPLLWRLLLVRLWAYFECPDELLHEGQLSAVEVWEGINASVREVGVNINEKMAIVEEKNPSLRGVLTDSTFFRWSYFADEVLRRLILALSSISRSYFANFDWAGIGGVLDQLIDEQLLKQADLKRYLVPSKVRDLMVALLEPQADWEVSDPFCGLGQLLVKACSRGSRGFGQEKSLEVYELARLSVALRRLDGVKITAGDLITAPRLLEEQGEAEQKRALGLQLFDGVISMLPLLQEEWGRNAALYDRYQRFPFGIPAEMEGEGAYLQHIVKSLKADGRAVVLIIIWV
jgi:type I restriction enzyme M protein